jgi:hypothetical protein
MIVTDDAREEARLLDPGGMAETDDARLLLEESLDEDTDDALDEDGALPDRDEFEDDDTRDEDDGRELVAEDREEVMLVRLEFEDELRSGEISHALRYSRARNAPTRCMR